MYLVASPDAASLAAPITLSREAQGIPKLPFGDAVEILSYDNNTSNPVTLFLAIDHYQGSQSTIPQSRSAQLEFRLVFLTNGSPLELVTFWTVYQSACWPLAANVA